MKILINLSEGFITKNNITELVFILDRSGSIAGLEGDTIGANIDSVGTARRFGIGADRAANYRADHKGTAVVFAAVSETAGLFRQRQPASARNEKINRGYNDRKKFAIKAGRQKL